MAIDKAEAPTERPTFEPQPDEKSDLSDEFASPEKSDEEPEWQDLLGSGSLLKKIVKEGQANTRPQRLQKCTISYELSLADGTFIERKDNEEIQLGDCDVVQGLDVAIGLMNVGEKCSLKIEPRLAFGGVGLPPKIPPNATVVYDIELVGVEPEDDPEMLSVLERKAQGNKKRERGNWWYGRGENTLAIQCYRRALDYLDEVETGIDALNKTEEIPDSTLQELLEDRISVCNNMAAAQIKLELYDAALNSLQTVLRCQPNNVKALFRKAKVHKGKNDLIAAQKCLKKADEVSPNNSDVQKELALISKLIQKQKVTERELAKRMFGDKKPVKEEKTKDSKHSMLVWSATLAASFAVGLAGVAAYRLKFA
ncbi:peptidyl-prolyl cis-trans isomerase FKBP8 [Tribolium castaneum]|uniref:peptidylprolyl isomerase n=1 Tax=Tribolium castaneum TaxID=7070 RepID=D6WQV5_TRICA|nr:PREDICTED: peptidyl-prolyl cis-trans isomerase FKBP8 [Tribolium castaneum]XP_966821.1 PREDICTED: peptidyl-prolyl cis-trans isomerase FKBP8 [Tribolium castaneum]EFA06496.1 Peptidyl-prolyl cis-trans isomerase FKBP8-like Protein [Tribolium castaneum]|eukprot:XP_008195078.1 PREDICTED: peptidyl-prolyl cis-trans isomerase FKBP8 [Tribolium castaneum]